MIKLRWGLLCVVLAIPQILSAATTSIITQGGITWIFDGAYEYGQYANGDYWVVGPLALKSITPNFVGSGSTARHGWMVNPVDRRRQAFDGRATSAGSGAVYDASLMPALPYTATAGSSLIKANSNLRASCSGDGPSSRCLTEVSVLTVVDSPPVNAGTTLFRPPFVGITKKTYSTASLRTDLLPSLRTVGNPSSIATYTDIWDGPQLEFFQGQTGCNLRPTNSYNPENDVYQPHSAKSQTEAILRLMLNDTVAQKMPLLVALIQGGIDRYYMTVNGQWWTNGCGHEPGHKQTIAFAALMLDDAAMQSAISRETSLHETRCIKSGVGGVPLFGCETPSELNYWQYTNKLSPGGNFSEIADPYGYIDGGVQQNYKGAFDTPKMNLYQFCCISSPWKGEALILSLLPEMQAFWGNTRLFMGYVERWVSHGSKFGADPCAPIDPVDVNVPYANWTKYGITWGPNGAGGCIPGSGRFPASDGGHANADNEQSAWYSTPFMFAMWKAYYAGISKSIR